MSRDEILPKTLNQSEERQPAVAREQLDSVIDADDAVVALCPQCRVVDLVLYDMHRSAYPLVVPAVSNTMHVSS